MILDLANLPIRVVLIETSHPGNIGSVARAMKTMHLSELRLVKPRRFPHQDASAMASSADDVVDRAKVFQTLEEAVADCGLVLGASARSRTLRWQQMNPREAAGRTLAEAQEHPVALVFGRESSGLTNDELALCHGLVHIPANPEYSSLNLAMAVQVMCYELVMASRVPEERQEPEDDAPDYATSEEMNYFFTHLERMMIDIDFLDPAVPKQTMKRVIRLFGRARPDKQELNILRGILTAVDKQGKKHKSNAQLPSPTQQGSVDD